MPSERIDAVVRTHVRPYVRPVGTFAEGQSLSSTQVETTTYPVGSFATTKEVRPRRRRAKAIEIRA